MNDSTKLLDTPEDAPDHKSITKMRVLSHCELPSACNSYMIANRMGKICGGNVAMFIPNNQATRLTYPKVFKSKGSGLRFIAANRAWMDLYEKYCADILNAGVKK